MKVDGRLLETAMVEKKKKWKRHQEKEGKRGCLLLMEALFIFAGKADSCTDTLCVGVRSKSVLETLSFSPNGETERKEREITAPSVIKRDGHPDGTRDL